MNVFKVGGAVRDRLLGLPVKDIDWVVVGADEQTLLDQGYKRVGADFPVFLHPHSHEEYALARTERKTAAGYRGFAVDASSAVTLEEDLLRRDLTINALAETTEGEIIDPCGGQADLQVGILRHVSPAFVEDPVRVLRVARFAARFDFRVAEETMALMRQMVGCGEVDALVAERVWAETDKALCSDHPHRFIEVLREAGALAVIFPEIDRLFGVPQTERYHPEIDTGVHLLMVMQMAASLSKDGRVRFACLTHDLGKGNTSEAILPSHHGHEERSVDLIHPLCDRLRVPNEYRQLAVLVARYHSHCHRITELRAATVLKALQGMDVFRRPERLDLFLIACEADARGRQGMQNMVYRQAQVFRQLYEAAAGIDIQALVERGLDGKKMAAAVERERLNAIRRSQQELELSTS